MKKLRFPAHGRRLVERRRAGQHPTDVTFIYGHSWRAGKPPRLALHPADYVPGKYDFCMVAGTRVLLLDQDCGAFEFNIDVRPAQFGKFYDLIAELADAHAYINIEWPDDSGWTPQDADALAYSFRISDPKTGEVTWPRWWSDERQRKHIAHFDGYIEDRAARVLGDRNGRDAVAADTN